MNNVVYNPPYGSVYESDYEFRFVKRSEPYQICNGNATNANIPSIMKWLEQFDCILVEIHQI